MPSSALVKAVLLHCSEQLDGAVHKEPYTANARWERMSTISRDDGSDEYSGLGAPVLQRCLPLKGMGYTLMIELTRRYKESDPDTGVSVMVEPKLKHGERRSFCVAALSNTVMKISLVWTDPAAGVNAPDTLVNDLDLEVCRDPAQLGNVCHCDDCWLSASLPLL